MLAKEEFMDIKTFSITQDLTSWERVLTYCRNGF